MSKNDEQYNGIEIEKYGSSNFEEVVSEEEVKKVFNQEEDLVNYGAKALAQVVNKIKPLKPFLKVLGIAKDWSLMQHKIILYENEIQKLSEDVKKLKTEGKFNDTYFKDEEFVTATIFFNEGLEKANSSDQVATLRRSYVNMLNNKNEQVNLKSKYVEIASHLTPQHISILGQIVKIFDELENSEEKSLSRTKGVTVGGALLELSGKGMILTYDEAAYLIRELEKNNLIECELARAGDQYRGQIVANKTLVVNPGSIFTAEELVEQLKIKGWIDSEGKILDKFDPEKEAFSLNLDDKYKAVENELINLLSQRNKIYLDFKKGSVSDFVDMALISKPTGFGKKFYNLVTEEIYSDNKNE